jgi:hypothetical protein
MKINQPLWLSCCLSGIALLYAIASIATNAQTRNSTKIVSNPAAIAPVRVTQAKPETAVLALDSSGLQVVNPTPGKTVLLPFGRPEANVVRTVSAVQGGLRDRGINNECGAGPLRYANWGNGLTLWFNQGVFAGWIVDGRNPGAKTLTTLAGIGTGSTRTQLNKAYTVKVQQTSLGTEFTAGTMGGILTGTKPTDKISSLWSGTTCLFR